MDRIVWLVPCLIVVFSVRVASADAQAQVPPRPLDLAWCLERAANANPYLAMDAASAAAAGERVHTAGALEDPRVAYDAVNVPSSDWDFESTPMSGHQLGLKQKLPFPGLLSNRKAAARAAAGAADWQLEDRRFRISAAVERAWAELGFAQRALAITDRNVALLRQLTRIAEAKYAVGSGRQQDVLRAQVELTRLLEERLDRVAETSRAEAALATLLDLSPDVELPATAELADESPLPALEDLLQRVEAQSPTLRMLAARIEEAERRHQAAKLEGYPDFDVGIGYRIRQKTRGDPVDGDDFVSAGLTIRLPVNRAKWRARVAERGALLRRARAEFRTARAAARGAVREHFADLLRAESQVGLVEAGLVPQARQSLASSRTGYEVDKVDFLSLIDSQVRFFEAELSLQRAWADRRAAFAAVEGEVGGTLR